VPVSKYHQISKIKFQKARSTSCRDENSVVLPNHLKYDLRCSTFDTTRNRKLVETETEKQRNDRYLTFFNVVPQHQNRTKEQDKSPPTAEKVKK
jgi:hypothetical protein